jgi:hypothetical protein
VYFTDPSMYSTGGEQHPAEDQAGRVRRAAD